MDAVFYPAFGGDHLPLYYYRKTARRFEHFPNPNPGYIRFYHRFEYAFVPDTRYKHGLGRSRIRILPASASRAALRFSQ
jgi:hypothetical protein